VQIRKILLHVMLWSLAVAAVCGAATILAAGNDIVRRVVATGITTAIAAGLMLGVTFLVDGEKTRAAGIFGMGAVTLEYLIVSYLIWIPDWGATWSALLGTAVSLAPVALADLLFLRLLHLPQARLASRVALVLSALVFVLFAAEAWCSYNWSPRYQMSETGAASAAFGVLAFGCLVGVGVDRRLWRHLGTVAAIAGFAMAFVAIWSDLHHESLFIITTSIAVVIAHANIVVLCPLKPPQYWVRYVAIGCALLAAISVDLESFLTPHGPSSLLMRSAGAAGFIAGCATMALGIFVRLNRGISRAMTLAEVRQITVTCPGCHQRQTVPVGQSQCANCKLRFHIRVEEPRCPNCDYLLLMLSADRCPECGTPIAPLISAPLESPDTDPAGNCASPARTASDPTAETP